VEKAGFPDYLKKAFDRLVLRRLERKL